MIVTIRQLQGSSHEYIAYTKSLCGKATYFVYFEDSIWGAVTLHNFIDMLKMFFQQKRVEVKVSEHTLRLKNKSVVSVLKSSEQQ
jgi:hypothetical protein